MAPTGHKADFRGSKTVTFNGGTGKNGATLEGGPLVDTKADENFPDKVISNLPSKLVMCQCSLPNQGAAASNKNSEGVFIHGDVYKSVIVRDHVDNDEALVFGR